MSILCQLATLWMKHLVMVFGKNRIELGTAASLSPLLPSSLITPRHNLYIKFLDEYQEKYKKVPPFCNC